MSRTFTNNPIFHDQQLFFCLYTHPILLMAFYFYLHLPPFPTSTHVHLHILTLLFSSLNRTPNRSRNWTTWLKSRHQKKCFLFILSFLFKLMRGNLSFDKSVFQHIPPLSLFLQQSSSPSRPFRQASFHFKAYFLSGYWTQKSRNYKEGQKKKLWKRWSKKRRHTEKAEIF